MTEAVGNPTAVRWRDSLIVRILVLCVVLVLCLLGAVYFLTGHYYRQVVATMEQQAEEVAQAVKIQLDALPEDELLENPPEDIEFDGETYPIGLEPIDPEIVDGMQESGSLSPQISAEGYYFRAERTIRLDSGKVAILTVRLDVNPQTELVRAFKNRYLMALSTVFLLTLGVMIYLIAHALKPIRELSASFAEISEGNLRNVNVQGSSGEVRALEETFNRMVASLREKETIEANLRQAQRLSAIGNLAAGVAHDVRNPLNAIKLLSSQALDDLGASDDQGGPAASLRTIRSEVDRLEDIVSGFLSLAREEELRREPGLIDPLLEECMTLVRNEAASRDLRLTAELRAGDTSLFVDQKQLTRAILNVLLNALEACDAGGRVRTFSRVTDQECEIEIRDDGPGIPKDIIEQVFDAYFTTRPTGTGLGLSITRGIVEEHGGKITITSSEGQGCQVLITLPLPSKAPEPVKA